MRHGLANKKLNRTSEHRKALLKNMLNSLIKYEQIKTIAVDLREALVFLKRPLFLLFCWHLRIPRPGESETPGRKHREFFLQPIDLW